MKRTFFIAGVQFRPGKDIEKAAKNIKPGDVLLLTPEPDNKFDPNAIKIEYSSQDQGTTIFLGYVPKKFSSEVSALLSIGTPISCIVESVDVKAKTYEMFNVTIKTTDEEQKQEKGEIK